MTVRRSFLRPSANFTASRRWTLALECDRLVALLKFKSGSSVRIIATGEEALRKFGDSGSDNFVIGAGNGRGHANCGGSKQSENRGQHSDGSN
jgi:hypothetical protein